MTVENTNNTISYTGNGSVTTFAYNFLTYSADHIFIYFDDVLQSSGFTITGVGDDNGGDVTFVSPPDTGVTIRIDRTVPDTQLLEYQEYGPFPAKANERGLDLLTMAVQQNARQIDRTALSKMDKQPAANTDNIVIFDTEGNSKDSGKKITDIERSGGSYVGENPPTFPQQGDRWTRCTDMKGFIWYVDVDGGQWVEDRPSYDIAGDGVLAFDTLDEAVNASNIFEGAALNLKERSSGNGGGAMWDVVEASSVTPNSYNIVQSSAFPMLSLKLRVGELIIVDQWGANKEVDSRGAIQAAINYSDSTDQVNIITSEGKRYLLKSTSLLPNYGGRVGLYIQRLDRTKISFNFGAISFDTSTPSLEPIQKDALLALAPNGEGASQAFASIDSIYLSGGNYLIKSNRAKNVIRADYFQSSYGRLANIEASFASEDVIKADQFVFEYNKVRARYAGELGAGFRFVSSSAANTGINMSTCTVDFAGLYGFRFEGGSGHTYCHLNNCHADFIGQDDNKDTIQGNIDTSFAYSLNDVRGFNLTSCGVEFSNAFLGTNNARNLKVSTIFGLGMGHSDGITPIPTAIVASGFFENISIEHYENRNPSQGGYDNTLSLSTPEQFNNNTITLDKSIPISSVTHLSGNPTSDEPLIRTLSDVYNGNARKGAGEIVLTGDRKKGSNRDSWYSSTAVLENTFYLMTSGSSVTKDLLEVLASNDSTIGVSVEILQVRTSVGATAKSLGFLNLINGNHTISNPKEVVPLMAGSGVLPTLSYNNNKLSITCTNSFTGHYIKVCVVQRAGNNYTRVDWL